MASDSLATVLLVGLGLDDLSLSPVLIPEIKQLVRAIGFDEARDIATRAIRLSTAAEVETLVKEFMRARFPELVEVKGW
jgi:phosphotransferase system enzyme I (PtsI)